MTRIPFSEIRAWMFESALPLWAGRGFDAENGVFREALGLDGAVIAAPALRTRGLCRQIYVYSHAALLGWAPAQAVAARAADYLHAKAWLGPDKGYAKLLGAEGQALDAKPDLYDLAFVLFAYAWRYRAGRDAQDLARAHEALDFIERQMRDNEGEGFWHEWPPGGPRQQNPHMHMLEAALVAFEASGEARFRALAEEIVRLFQTRFFNGVTLAEFFDKDWKRVDGEAGRLVEPGHQLEWAWILAQYQRLTGADVTREAKALVDFAERFGVDPQSQAVFMQIRDDGAPLDQSSRSWPNTERIKGWIGIYELTGADPRAAIAGSSRLLLDRYLKNCAPGAWVDHFDADGKPISTRATASTFYHVFLAFAEVLRLEEKLG
jgi:N-acylglucosamine 2-epimerase/mannose-6-phosphate isomerase